jgi:hypothetical protein
MGMVYWSLVCRTDCCFSAGLPDPVDHGNGITLLERVNVMNEHLKQILTKIETDHRHIISDDARNYKEVDLSHAAAELGLTDARDCYRHVNAIVPLKAPLEGMKVRIDGRTFVNYVQFDSGVAVPNYVAEKSQIPHKRYEAWDSMILNFT